MAKSFNPSQKIKTTPEKPNNKPVKALLENFSNPIIKLTIKINTGDKAEIREVKLLLRCASAAVVSPFAPISINVESKICILKFLKPIHFKFLVNKSTGNKITAAKNCLIPATNQEGTVSTPILIAKKVVPQKKATVKMASKSFEFKRRIYDAKIPKIYVFVPKIFIFEKSKLKSKMVSIIMGSQSDLPIMQQAADFLKSLEIPYELTVVSAHRTPERMFDFAKTAKNRGVKVIIAGAGGAAHLPGMVASCTTLPVIGVPILSSNSIDGWDSVLSILQMPSGIPVATVALNGATNAGILAAKILGTYNEEISTKLEIYQLNLKEKVLSTIEEIKKEHPNSYDL